MEASEVDPDLFVKIEAFTASTYRDVYPAIDPARDELSQSGKVIVITGASKGLGKLAFAASFARANAAAIVLLARTAAGLAETEQLIKEINPSTQVLSIAVDVRDREGIEDAFQQIVSRFGTPHVLINSAGVLISLGKIVDQDPESWWQTQEVNVRGTFNATRAFLQRTGPTPATPTTIINLTSASGKLIPPGMSAYSLSKLAVTKFTAYVNDENPGITCFSLNPGVVHTDLAHTVPFLAPFTKDTPELGGGTAVWLASGDKSYLSGRFVDANWDVEELEARKEEIVREDLLTICYKGSFGPR